MDLEGTVVQNEFLVDMARLKGAENEVTHITESAMSGKIPLSDAINKRFGLIKGISFESVLGVAENVCFNKGAEELIEWLESEGCETAIVSNGFLFFAEKIAKKLKVKEVYANNLVFKNNILDSAETKINKEAVAKKYLDSGFAVIAVGDGANDIEMFRNSSVSFAIGDRKEVIQNADFSVFGLSEIKEILEKPFFVVSSDVKLPDFKGNILRFDSDADLLKRIPIASVLVVRSQKITKEILEKAPNLKLIIRQGVGLDNIDAVFCNEKGIEVINTPLSAPSVVELVVGFMVLASRKIIVHQELMKKGEWENRNEVVGTELFGKTIGIVGLGRIGSGVARVCHALGMRVIYYDPFVEETLYEKRFCIEKLFEESDILTFHVPLTNETKHMLNSDNVNLLKNGAILINASRGKVVEFESVKKALENNLLSAVCLDVHYQEPPEYASLLGDDRLILTPHLGGSTIEAQKRMEVRVKEILLQKGFGG